jgi:hypothetical protein
MGIIIAFPADAASRKRGSTIERASRQDKGKVLILPVVRIEREIESSSGGRGPQEGTAQRRRRRRR